MKINFTIYPVLGIAILLFFNQGHAQQVQLRGTVAVHNSKYKTGKVIYVQNTYLTAPFTKPALTDVKGAFTLEFVGLDPGMAMRIEASKQALEIVNTRDLDEVIIGRKLPLRIYVTEKGNLVKAQMELLKVSKQALFASRDQMIARLRGEKAESEAAVAELQKRFGQELKDRFAAEDLSGTIPPQIKILPERLKAAGYATAMVGKWHLGMRSRAYLPQHRGFDRFYGYYTGVQDCIPMRCSNPRL